MYSAVQNCTYVESGFVMARKKKLEEAENSVERSNPQTDDTDSQGKSKGLEYEILYIFNNL